MVGYWSPVLTGPTGTQLLDLSGENNVGTLTNMDSATDWVLDRYGSVLDFDGTNDYVTIPNSRSHSSGNQITISCWVKRNAAGVYYELVAKYAPPNTSSANEDGWLLRWSNTNILTWTLANNATYHAFTASAANTSTAWTHIALTHQFGSAGSTAIYVDGSVIAASWTIGAGTIIPDSSATNYAINLGVQRYNNVSYNLLAGRLDDVRVFYGLLTSTQIASLASKRGYQPTGFARRRIGGSLLNNGLINRGLAR
jgi:hypothetical protein